MHKESSFNHLTFRFQEVFMVPYLWFLIYGSLFICGIKIKVYYYLHQCSAGLSGLRFTV